MYPLFNSQFFALCIVTQDKGFAVDFRQLETMKDPIVLLSPSLQKFELQTGTIRTGDIWLEQQVPLIINFIPKNRVTARRQVILGSCRPIRIGFMSQLMQRCLKCIYIVDKKMQCWWGSLPVRPFVWGDHHHKLCLSLSQACDSKLHCRISFQKLVRSIAVNAVMTFSGFNSKSWWNNGVEQMLPVKCRMFHLRFYVNVPSFCLASCAS